MPHSKFCCFQVFISNLLSKFFLNVNSIFENFLQYFVSKFSLILFVLEFFLMFYFQRQNRIKKKIVSEFSSIFCF